MVDKSTALSFHPWNLVLQIKLAAYPEMLSSIAARVTATGLRATLRCDLKE